MRGARRADKTGVNGLIDLYKPPSMSSAFAVSRVKRILGEKTVGHMGTLDPMAEGVLIIGVGKSARLFDYLAGHKKTYVAKFKFGYRTDTLDALGNVVATTKDIPGVDAVYNAMRSLIGKIDQIPPQFSAKHIDGKRAYDLARRGETVSLKPSRVEIFDTELICQPALDEFVFSITCSAGTYIRSICRDVAEMCGSLATLTYLQRTRSGMFDVKDSIDFETLERIGPNALIPPDKAVDLERYDVDTADRDDLDHGRKLRAVFDGDARIYCGGVFYGIGQSADGVLKLKTYLKDD